MSTFAIDTLDPRPEGTFWRVPNLDHVEVNCEEKLILLCTASRSETSRARLASYGRRQFGANVPVGEYDFGCCEELLGGELT